MPKWILAMLSMSLLAGLLALTQANVAAAPLNIPVPATAGPMDGRPGTTGFVTTGIILGAGDQATVTAVDGNPPAYLFTDSGHPFFGPNGDPATPLCINGQTPCPAPNLRFGALLARVGNGPWVLVGTGPTVLTGTGEIFFALNDGKYFDNTGGFIASVTLSPPTDADQCKKGGWMLRVDSQGHSFKNQGDCVSYVATGGRNPAAGG